MSVRYFEKWVRAKRRPTVPLDVPDARYRHVRREPYVAAIYDDSGRPTYVVDLAADWVSVYFLDDKERIYLNYDFREMEPNRLFLSSAIHREFDGDSADVRTSTTFAFKTDGSIVMERRDHVAGSAEERESFADPAVNWEESPAFGEYANLCRVDRGSKPRP
jgi:hypothetical protein